MPQVIGAYLTGEAMMMLNGRVRWAADSALMAVLDGPMTGRAVALADDSVPDGAAQGGF